MCVQTKVQLVLDESVTRFRPNALAVFQRHRAAPLFRKIQPVIWRAVRHSPNEVESLPQAKPKGTLRSLYCAIFSAFSFISRTNFSSLIDARLISTLANAPSSAARASARAVVRSDFMFGFVTGP